MATKSKIDSEKNETEAAASDSVAGDGGETAEPKKKSRAVAAKPRTKKPAAKKNPMATKTRSPSKKTSGSPSHAEPSDDEIRLRAYFIAERRIQLSLPGDSAHDWIEARRQLIEEYGR